MTLSILHIDDDTVMRMMVKKAIERSSIGASIVSCSTPQEFFDSLKEHHDVLLIDVMMPLMNGLDVLKKVRSKNIPIPAIFMTGHEELHLPNRDTLEPIIGIIQKPFSPLTLGDTLQKMLEEFGKS